MEHLEHIEHIAHLQLKDLLYIFCKDQATKALADISLIDKSISTIPTEEYIQTFISQFTKEAYICYSASKHHIAIISSKAQFTNDGFLKPSPVDENMLNLQIESGFWVYRTNGINSEASNTVYHEFICFGDSKQAYKDATRHIKEYKKIGMYTWVGLINTTSQAIQFWKQGGKGGSMKDGSKDGN